MIKKISEDILNIINPNLSEEEKKWINVFNEHQYRIDLLFEGLVSWYSLGLLIEQLTYQGLGHQRELYPMRYKMAIYQSYIFVELNNLLDPKGKSSITTFNDYFSKDLYQKTPRVRKIFKSKVKIDKLEKHFKLFDKWLEQNKDEVKHIKSMRDKNYSHVDTDFKYENKVSYEYMISTIVFISDYLSVLPLVLDFTSYRVVEGKPVSINKTLEVNTSKEVLEIRFKQEINQLANNINFSDEAKKIFLLNCYDSIDATLKNVELLKN